MSQASLFVLHPGSRKTGLGVRIGHNERLEQDLMGIPCPSQTP